jgi:endonuclease/exonuclease/phosphatase family metal-dependent hydrolase
MSQITAMDFNIVQYNTFARPYLLSHDGQKERLERIPEALAKLNNGSVDVITLCEVFFQVENELCSNMLRKFEDYGFKHHTRVLEGTGFEFPGAVMMVSKWPLRPADGQMHVYRDACDGSDCLAAKGVLYAAVDKTENGVTKTFHVFATHMQAWENEKAVEARNKQASQMTEFVKQMNIPSNEPVLFAGDFNVDLVRYAQEFKGLSEILDAELPKMIGQQRYTSDPSSNLLVGRDGAAEKCQKDYEASWGEKSGIINHTYHPTPESKNPTPTSPKIHGLNPFFADPKDSDTLYIEPGGCYCSCCPHEWLDYILVSKKHQRPSGTSTLECIRIKAGYSFEVAWSGKLQPVPEPLWGDKIILSDLSDHYPVIGRFVFPG